jgi:hypothetical protein
MWFLSRLHRRKTGRTLAPVVSNNHTSTSDDDLFGVFTTRL